MRPRTLATAVLILAATSSLAVACSVPVFRYALEHWRPDPYVVYVFHADALSDEQKAIVDSLQPRDTEGNSLANVIVRPINVNTDDDPVTQQIWRDHASETLPWMAVLSPPKWGPAQTVFQGRLTAENATSVLESPKRTEISRRLLNGESVVWVLLECGRKEEDDAAFSVLEQELRKQQSEIKLPEIEEEDLGDLSVAPDALKVVFSAIRIARDHETEQAFRDMLLRIEPDLLDEPQISQPMAIPVFGRGRALYALVGKGIAPDVIEEACVFLTGGCQCTVKAQNPGVDLIMNVDWDKMVVPTQADDEPLPPLAGFTGFGQPDNTSVINVNGEPDLSETPPLEQSAPAAMAVTVSPTDTGLNSSIVGQEQGQEALAPAADQRSAIDTDTSVTHEAASTGIGRNVFFVLMSLVAVVVFTTYYFLPRAN
ncbi:MAG: hypothetical protein KDB01_05485 [Planctomycetaceae bacterium]|nr:hypothetical protein [Planctomycetaceae bacterium]